MSPSVSVRLLLTQSDERLVGYARAGHERAFEALVQRYRRQLLAYCRRLLLSEQRAEDALQQALLQAWVALRDGAEVREPRPWLYRIVHNAAIGALRVSGYDYCQLSESLSGADAPQDDLDRRIAVREALAGLAALPQMQRETLLRTAVEGRSHQQVASDLGLSEPAVRGLVYRARAALRGAVGALVPPPALGWALSAGTRGAPAVDGAAGLAGGGSAGLAGLLTKGGAVAVTAGALAGGLAAAHHHRARAHPAVHTTGAHAAEPAGSTASGGAAQPDAFTRPTGHRAPLAIAERPGQPLGADTHAAPRRWHVPHVVSQPTWTPLSHHDHGSRQAPRQPTSGAQSSTPSGTHDGHSDGFGVSAPGSSQIQSKDGSASQGGGDTSASTTGSTTASGQDRSGDSSGSTSGELTTSGDGSSSGKDGSGDATTQSGSGSVWTTGTSDSKDGVTTEGSFK